MTNGEPTEIPQANMTDSEPTPHYSVGDIIRSKLTSNPDIRFVLIEPVNNDSAEGPIVNRVQIDPKGDSVGSIGSIHTVDIAEIVGHLSPKEVVALHTSALVEQYPTMDPDDVKRLARAAFQQ